MLRQEDLFEMFAESENVSVYRCERGCLHLTIGPLGLRLSLAEFAEIAAVVLCAAERIPAPPSHGHGAH